MRRMHWLAAVTAALVAVAPVRADELPPAGVVTAVSIVPTPGRAEIVIDVNGAVDIKDFVLREPTRLVIDVMGATLSTTGGGYDGVNRAGVTDVRYSQFRPDVVRVAVYLDGLRDYRVERDGNAIRVSFGADQNFLAWSSQSPASLQPPTAKVVSQAPSAPEVNQATPPARSAGNAAEPRITVTWDKADISDVVAGFAAFSNRTIILGKDVKGQVTAEIKNQPWPEAFAAVLATQGLQAIELPGGIIRVDSPGALAALDSIEPLQTRMVSVNYVQAASLVGSIKAILSKRGSVVADTTSNGLIITETRSRLGDVSDFVKNLDIRTPQISIQSKIIFVDRTDVQSLGLQYDLGDDGTFFNKLIQRPDPNNPGSLLDKNTVAVGGSSVAAIANADAVLTAPALSVVFSTAIGGFNLSTFIQALQSVELADVQAEPLISTLDNRQAFVNVGEDVPVRVIDVSSAAGSTAPPKATVQFKETGIKLTVTPHVTANRQILMSLTVERSNIRTLAAADLGFTIQKQNAQNQLLVADGETAVIGGLTVTDINRTRSGIPFLVDLPIVGKLFGFSTTSEQRRDLIILVTPRIIDEGTD